jgi:hypothetical protein
MVEQLEVLLALFVERELNVAQLLILHLELDLMDPQLVQNGRRVLVRWRGTRSQPAQYLLGLAAQFVGLAWRESDALRTFSVRHHAAPTT